MVRFCRLGLIKKIFSNGLQGGFLKRKANRGSSLMRGLEGNFVNGKIYVLKSSVFQNG